MMPVILNGILLALMMFLGVKVIDIMLMIHSYDTNRKRHNKTPNRS
jgi:hypothetical protein